MTVGKQKFHFFNTADDYTTQLIIIYVFLKKLIWIKLSSKQKNDYFIIIHFLNFTETSY